MNVLPNTPSPPVEALDRLLELVVLLGEDMTQALVREGLTVPRARLVWLIHHRGAATQRALADALKVTPRNVTGLVDGLVATGLVTREAHPTDRRATLVSLTERGASTLAEMDSSHRALATLLFGDMADRQFGSFLEGLDHVLSRLREVLEAPGEGDGQGHRRRAGHLGSALDDRVPGQHEGLPSPARRRRAAGPLGNDPWT